MNTLATTLAINIVALVSVVAQSNSNVRPLSAKPDEKWVIRWNRSDDFNADDVDWRKWHQSPEKFSAWEWDNGANVSVSEGNLKITLRKKPKPDSGFTSGMLKSYAKGTYAYYEARIKGAPLFPGVCPAFWLYSKIDDTELAEGAVRYSEVDIVELTQRGTQLKGSEKISDHNLHAILSNGKKGIAGREWRRPHDPRYRDAQAIEHRSSSDPRLAFHTYGCRVGKEEIIWFVDGKEIGRKKNEHWHRPMNVALSLGLRTPFAEFKNNRLVANQETDTSGLPTSMLVDYVRVWELDANSAKKD